MSLIKRIGFQKSIKDSIDFEIVKLHNFFENNYKDKLFNAHRLDFYIIMYITSGTGKHEIDFITYNINKGDVVFIAKNQVHRFLPETDVKGYILLFTEELLYGNYEIDIQDFIDQFNIPVNIPVNRINSDAEETSRVLIDLLYKEYKSEDNNMKLIKILFTSYLLAFKSNSYKERYINNSNSSKRFVEFKNLVEAHYAKKKTVKDYADMMLVTQKTINQITRQTVDLSAKQYIINRLILEIKRCLGQGELTINEIADLLGFDESSNLTKFFKRYEGLSPTEFKKKYY